MSIESARRRAAAPTASPLAAGGRLNSRSAHERAAAVSVAFSIFALVAQGCGTSVDDPFTVEIDPRCPTTPCADGFACVDAVCVSTDGLCLDEDGDGFGPYCATGDDCDDTNPNARPGATEVENDIDDDCDYYVDEDTGGGPVCTPACSLGDTACDGDRVRACVAADDCLRWGPPSACADGTACVDGACGETCIDEDGDGQPVRCPGQRDDCDDTNPTVFVGATERCDGADNNCNDRTDENGVCEDGCVDACEIGEVSCNADQSATIECIAGSAGCGVLAPPRRCGSERRCERGACVDFVECVDLDDDGFGPGCAGDDCRPVDPNAGPRAAERCDGVDQNCDGDVDEGGVCGRCVEATAAAPASVDAHGLYRVACSPSEVLSLAEFSSTGSVAVVASSSSAPLSFQIGQVRAGAFVANADSFPIGLDAGFVGPLPADAFLRVVTTVGAPYAVAVATSERRCTSDDLEPNDSPLASTPLGSLPFVAGLTRCAGDSDYFSIDAPLGSVLTVTAVFDGGAGDVLPRVWLDGAEVSPSLAPPFVDGTPRGRYSHFRADVDGTWQIGARARTDLDAVPYALAIQARAPARCADDSVEVEGGVHDDTLETGRALRAGRSRDGVICPGDVDVISVGRLAAGDLYRGTLDAPPGIDFIVVRDTLRSLFHDGTADTLETTFASNVSSAGEYYVLVYGRDAGTTGAYSYTHSF